MNQDHNSKAVRLVITHYFKQFRADLKFSLPALLLPGVGNILVFYVPPLIVARVLTDFTHNSHPSSHQVLSYALQFAGLWLLGEALWRLAILTLTQTETRGMTRLYVNAMDYLFAKDQAFFNNNFAGSLTKKVIGYGRHYEDVMDSMSFNVTSNLIPMIFAGFILWRYSPWLVFALVGMLGISLSIAIPLIKSRQKLVRIREKASNVMAGNIADTITNMTTVRSFAQEEYEAKRHRENAQHYMTMTKDAWNFNTLRLEMALSPLYVLTNTIGLIIALSLSANGALNVAAIFISFNYFANISSVMWKFNQIYRSVESAITDAAQFTELILDEPAVKDVAATEMFKPTKGPIEFKNVTFRYSDASGQHLFQNLNLIIAEGEKVALVGRSGGGKTTITTLLLRYMDIESGQILIGGTDIAKVPQQDLRSSIAYVPQDSSLFHRSLSENISYSKHGSTDANIIEVAKMAHADEFIKGLSHQYDTLVGERGVKLSGGQRQRIAIARAMLKDAPILVLDEATSALDSESEKLIQDALWKLMEGKTVIAIAHRLSTIQKMDRILVMENGQIAEQGSHAELLKNNGIYASLWAHQSGGFLEE